MFFIPLAINGAIRRLCISLPLFTLKGVQTCRFSPAYVLFFGATLFFRCGIISYLFTVYIISFVTITILSTLSQQFSRKTA